MTDDRLEAAIRSDRIDILVDLSGHTMHNRLTVFARRAAPVQLSWIGYPNTTGLAEIDYRITDEIADPPGEGDCHYTERLWRLKRPFLVYTPSAGAPDVAAPPCESGVPLTFGAFGTPVKIGDETVALWSRALAVVPEARLLIKSPFGLEESEAREAIRDRFAAQGIDRARIDVVSSLRDGYAEHLGAYDRVDIALDTFPYNGTTTTCEALSMGVPVVSLVGDRHVSRVGKSLLTSVGLGELAVSTPDEYAARCAGLAADRERLRTLRASMRERLIASPLLDGKDLAASIQNAWRSMWEITRRNAAQDSGVDGWVTIAGGVKVCVAEAAGSVTTWALLEHEDSFEDEIGFVRRLCRPDWVALDIGANHGLYSLALAGAGASRVWAFEPAALPRRRFAKSVAENGFSDRIEIMPMGLSDAVGEIDFNVPDNSELASFSGAAAEGATRERARVETLDALLGAAIPSDVKVAFVKLDAEGEESKIVRAGGKLFRDASPLVMFKYRRGATVNAGLLDEMRALGYGIYRFVPGLVALQRLSDDPDEAPDDFVLNLFACKTDRAAELARAGPLIADAAPDADPVSPAGDWIEPLLGLPAVPAECAERWRDFDYSSPYGQAVRCWAGAQAAGLLPGERLARLEASAAAFAGLGDDPHPAVALLATRVLADIGERDQAAGVAHGWLDRLPESFPDDRPCPPALKAFDRVAPAGSYGELLRQSFIEFAMLRGSRAGCFVGDDWPQMRAALRSPERSVALERRAILVSAREGSPLSLSPSTKVFQPSPDNRNAALWREVAVNWGVLDPDAPAVPMRLHVGGEQPKEGWKILNVIPGPHVDLVRNLLDLGDLPSGSCSEIYASHVLEHVGYGDIVAVFGELNRLLVTGGRLYVSVPDLDALCRLFIDPSFTTPMRFRVSRVMFGGQSDPFDFHLIGLAWDFLNDYLRNSGFSDVRRVGTLGIFDDASTDGSDVHISLNVIATK